MATARGDFSPRCAYGHQAALGRALPQQPRSFATASRVLRRQELARRRSPCWGWSERNIPQTAEPHRGGGGQGAACREVPPKPGLRTGGCTGDEKAPGWEMPPAAVPMAMLQGWMPVATGDGAAVGRAELEEAGALGKRRDGASRNGRPALLPPSSPLPHAKLHERLLIRPRQ